MCAVSIHTHPWIRAYTVVCMAKYGVSVLVYHFITGYVVGLFYPGPIPFAAGTFAAMEKCAVTTHTINGRGIMEVWGVEHSSVVFGK